MVGLVRRCPRRAKVFKLRLDTFNIEPDFCPRGKLEPDLAAWFFARHEYDGQQNQDSVASGLIEPGQTGPRDALESQTSPAAFEGGFACVLRGQGPVEAIAYQGKLLLRPKIGQIGNPHERVLALRREDSQVLCVEGLKFDLCHSHWSIPYNPGAVKRRRA